MGQGGWQHPEDWQQGATHTEGRQLTGRHLEDWQEGATHTMGLQLTGAQQATWHLTGTHTVGLQLTGTQQVAWQGPGRQQAGWQPEEQLVWHMVAEAGWRWGGGGEVWRLLPWQPLYAGRASGQHGSSAGSSWLASSAWATLTWLL